MRRAHMASGALQRETPERLPAIAQLGNKRPDEQATTVVQVNNGESEHAGAPVAQFREHHAEAMVAQLQQELTRLRGREAARMAEEIAGLKEQMEKLRKQHKVEKQEYREELKRKDEQLQQSHAQIVSVLRDAATGIVQVPAAPRAEVSTVFPHGQRVVHTAVVAPPVSSQARVLQPAEQVVTNMPNNDAPQLSAEAIEARLRSGGDDAEATLVLVLERALEIMEALALKTPRRQRGQLKALCDRLEAALVESEADIVVRIATCEPSDLRQLGQALCMLGALHTHGADIESTGTVERALAELERCGDVVAAASRQLTSVTADVRLYGLHTMQSLPRVVLEEPVAAEVEMIPMLQKLALDSSASHAEREPALMGIFAVGLRNTGTDKIYRLTKNP